MQLTESGAYVPNRHGQLKKFFGIDELLVILLRWAGVKRLAVYIGYVKQLPLVQQELLHENSRILAPALRGSDRDIERVAGLKGHFGSQHPRQKLALAVAACKSLEGKATQKDSPENIQHEGNGYKGLHNEKLKFYRRSRSGRLMYVGL